jgi:hypothetical protein
MSDPSPEWLSLQQQVHEQARSLHELQRQLNERIDAHIRFAAEAREKAEQAELTLRALRKTTDELLLFLAFAPHRPARRQIPARRGARKAGRPKSIGSRRAPTKSGK